MARKKENLKKSLEEKWNLVLVKAGLSVERGRSRNLVYIGGSADIEMLEITQRTDDGRVPVSGTCDEEFEK